MSLAARSRSAKQREAREYVLGRFNRYGPADGSIRDELVATGERVGALARSAGPHDTATQPGRGVKRFLLRSVLLLVIATGAVVVLLGCGNAEGGPGGGSEPAHETRHHEPQLIPGELSVAARGPQAPSTVFVTRPHPAALYATARSSADGEEASPAGEGARRGGSPAEAEETTRPEPGPSAEVRTTPTTTPAAVPAPATSDAGGTDAPVDLSPAVQSTSAAASRAEADTPGVDEALFLRLMNEEREAAGLAPLRRSSTLTELARHRSSDMSANGYFAHTSPAGETWISLVQAAGAAVTAGGENLARVSGDPERAATVAVEKLMESDTHRANILNPSFTLVGVGAATDGDGVTVFTSIFTD